MPGRLYVNLLSRDKLNLMCREKAVLGRGCFRKKSAGDAGTLLYALTAVRDLRIYIHAFARRSQRVKGVGLADRTQLISWIDSERDTSISRLPLSVHPPF